MINLIDFWRIQRKQTGQQTIIRPCHMFKAKALTDLVLGKLPTPNLMILEPPRIGKTDLGVKAFVPWSWSYFPDSEYIIGGYGADLPTESAVHIRNTLSSPWYKSMVGSDWGCNVALRGAKASGRSDYFKTLEGGVLKAVGRGGSATGFGIGKLRPEFGGCGIADDLLKAQESTSAPLRKAANVFLMSALMTRRNRLDDPSTPIVLIMQRLHPDDPAGHLLKTERHRWTIVQIPAHNEKGQSIWEERISSKELQYMKEYAPDVYHAQYMQEPIADGYNIFKAEWWGLWDDRKAVEKKITWKFITGDTAFKAKDSSDYSVFQCWGAENTRGLYLMDQIRGKWEFPELVKRIKEFKNKHTRNEMGITPATELWIEDKASGTSLVQTLRAEGIPCNAWGDKESDGVSGDKAARAKQTTLTLQQGREFVPDPRMPGYEWVDIFVGEHVAFTSDDSHAYDDQVDTRSMANLIWQKRGGGVGPLPTWNNLRKYANGQEKIYRLE
jgi:predicted phage terminase large subunit-like protein